MRPPANAPRIRDYLRLLVSGWLVILLATAASAGAGWLAWQTSAPLYVSTARVFVTTPGSATTLDAYYGHLNSISRIVTLQHLARSPQVTMRTIEQLDLDETPAELATTISVRVRDSAMLDIVVTGDEPDQTRRIANAAAEHLVRLSKEMATVDTSSPELVLVDPADPSVRQGSMWRFIIPAGAIGLAISCVLVLAYGLLRDKLYGKGHVDHVVDEALTREG
ncbi:MAG TPA: hypothetical protein VHH12_07150 [Mycobacterium sp.]|nr:hypothetical protein [Mycobacterium sp.]